MIPGAVSEVRCATVACFCEWESGVEGGYARRAACLRRVKLGRKLEVRAKSAIPTTTDLVAYSAPTA